ncbi:unnamed protein product [Victoria cruziana]
MASQFMDSGMFPNRDGEGKLGELSSFSWMCSRLSQYNRENRGFSDLSLGLSFNIDIVSGAIQHLEGTKGCKVIVAVNNDSDAPIFQASPQSYYYVVFLILHRLCGNTESGGWRVRYL